MKKITKATAVITAAVIQTCSILSLNTAGVHAADNPDLSAMAASLGADSDCFSFANYTPENFSEETRDKFFEEFNCYYEDFNTETITINEIKNTNNAMAVLQMLVHNGIIPVSAIQDDALSLSDVTIDDNVNDILCYYQLMQGHSTKQQLAGNYYYCNNDDSDKCNDLIELGRKASENGDYFMIFVAVTASYDGTVMYNVDHALTGIGCADGNWSFNGKSYDKCILTLDNSVSAGFNENMCIYINSATNEYYIPGFDNTAKIRFVTDDETLLNYQGLINPSETIETNISGINRIHLRNYAFHEFTFTVNDGEKSSVYEGEPTQFPEGISKNYFKDSTYGRVHYIDGESFSISAKMSERTYNTSREESKFILGIQNDSTNVEINGKGDFDADVTKDTITLKSNNTAEYLSNIEHKLTFDIFSISDSNASPFGSHSFSIYSTGTFTMSAFEDGFLVSDTGLLEMSLSASADTDEFFGYIHEETGTAIPGLCEFQLTASAPVYVEFDEENKRYTAYIDPDKNGVYDTLPETGDANCDGEINASDASVILRGYAAAQTGEYEYLNSDHSDFNNDGIIDAIDSSAILRHYVEIQTT